MVGMEELKRKFIELLDKDNEFRYLIMGYLGLSEVMKRLEGHDRKFNEVITELKRHSEILEKHDRKFNEIMKRLEEHDKRLEELSIGLRALGARWGIMAEESFRNAMKGIVEKYFDGKISKWEYYDSEGIVYGYPSMVEVDIVIKDKVHILVEIKSSVHRGDVIELYRIAELYNREVGVKPRIAIVSPYIDSDAVKLSEKLGIETYSSLSSS